MRACAGFRAASLDVLETLLDKFDVLSLGEFEKRSPDEFEEPSLIFEESSVSKPILIPPIAHSPRDPSKFIDGPVCRSPATNRATNALKLRISASFPPISIPIPSIPH